MTRADTGTLLVRSSAPGTSGIYMTAGIPSTDQKPGAGGANGFSIYNEPASEGVSGTWNYTDGQPGQPSLEAAGGAPGRGPTGWFGTGKTVPTAGENAPTSDPYYRFCGAGGGGGGGGANGPGGKGGDPGGGGGTGSPNDGGIFGGSATNGGPGGRGEIVVWAVFAPLPVE
ncbi:hypothetical protein TPA2_gp37 [Tsukamurella phage TPA2]|uniref:hypothetical protein n=1 Tax=Tsukamurella phage TPA2 TaxID=981330 RepID=UPI0001FF8DBC|nr:hypothetical protein TPA2_gp37 [Tsukamurella phage TPA2]ADX31951.1 hypothetical protein [Tsukamurella phage TPA2]